VTEPSRVLLVFLDGVGIGPDDAQVNPFVRAAEHLPALRELTGGVVPTLEAPRVSGPAGSAFPLAATLDVDGTPQSGTGQVALLTGENGAALFGRHFGPWTPVRLRPLVEARSVLKRAAEAGRTVAFANAYPRGWPGRGGGRRLAAPPLAARAAGVLTMHVEALAQGEAVASEVVNDAWRRHLGFSGVPVVTATQAGANLARIAARADLTLFAHYATDAAGHSRDMARAVAALQLVDDFLGGLLDGLTGDTLLVVASDHGNLEDVRTGHTRNPALGLAAGPGASDAARLTDLRQLAPFVLRALGVEG
jgi:hypothetical protein